jgi:hypothetical protein
MLQLLAERKVTYPVLVTSGLAKANDVRKCAGPKLNITFLQKPYTLEQFNRVLLTQVGPKTNSNVCFLLQNEQSRGPRTHGLLRDLSNGSLAAHE